MILLDAYTARAIIDAIENEIGEIGISFDLGISTTKHRPSEFEWDIEQLRKIAQDPDSFYFIKDGEFFKAAISGEHFYKLFPTEQGKAPALLIDGVLMHRVKETDPLQDAASKAKLCARKDFEMLEICTGLGYSTIACLDRGVRSIITIEREKDVIELAMLNPWSRRLFSDKRVTIVEGDAVERIQDFRGTKFHAVLHDPPRFSMGSELYTKEFYSEIFRVLRPGGTLFHYVGNPGSRYRKRDLQKGVMTRLREVGFTNLSRKEQALGVVGKKRK